MRSLNLRFTHVEIAAHKANADFVFLTEVWLDAQKLGAVTIPNYMLASSYTRNQYGGTAIWVKNTCNFKFREISLSSLCIDKHFEICGITMNFNGRKHVYLCVYRTPDSDINVFLQQLTIVLEKFVGTGTDLFLCGDFNVNWLESNESKDGLLDIFSSCGLINIVEEPTRKHRLLDYVCVSVDPASMYYLVEDVTFSDHRSITFSYKYFGQGADDSVCYYRDMSVGNKNNFKVMLRHEIWQDIHLSNDVDDMVNIFLSILDHYCGLCFPERRKMRSRTSGNGLYGPKEWYTAELRMEALKLKDLYLLKQNFPDLTPYYKFKKSEYDRKLARARKDYYDAVIDASQNKSRTAWRIIGQHMGKTRAVKQIDLSMGDRNITDPSEVADTFNNHFVQVASKTLSGVPQIDYAFPGILIRDHSFFLSPVTESEVFNIIRSLKSKHSKGVCGYTNAFIREFGEELTGPLTHIINLLCRACFLRCSRLR